ncbi:MAG: hypothetical protein ACYTHJ_04575 [Planctomycetota bacterium]|jgi:hypothetical protein
MKKHLVIVGAAVAAISVAPAYAQDCPCDCYFSGDCNSGEFCNWGNLSIEDSCFWRQPKPQGVVGANCDQDYNDWGQCDGICSASAATTLFSEEPVDQLIGGVALWAAAFNEASSGGGGFVDPLVITEAESLAYTSPEIFDYLGKVVIEALLISRGEDYIIFPKTDMHRTEDVAVEALGDDNCRARAGNVALEILLAEMAEAGSGAGLLDQLPAGCLDNELLTRVCGGSGDPLSCLYGRLYDFGAAIARGGREGGIAAVGANCDTTVADPRLEPLGGRYLLAIPDTTGLQDVALRLTSPSLPCLIRYITPEGTLSVNPVFLPPTEWGSVAVSDAMIIPDTVYELTATSGTNDSQTVTASTWKWADADSNDVVNYADIQLTVLGFQLSDVVTMEAVDHEPCYPNAVINFNDIQHSVFSFQGMAFLETGCGTPCSSE